MRDEMTALVDGMSARQKRMLREMLTEDLKNRRDPITNEEQDVWDALTWAIGIKESLPLFLAQPTMPRSKYQNAVDIAQSYVRRYCPGLKRMERLQVMRVCFRALMRVLREKDIEPTPHEMVANMSSLAWAVDQEFPGYAEAGLLARVAAPRRAA